MNVRTGLIQTLRRNTRAALWRRDFKEAFAVLERLKAEEPLAVETRGLELEYLLNTGDLKNAAVLATQLLRLFPDSARIQYLAGQVSYQQKDYPRAQERFAESGRLHPSWRTRRWLGKTFSQMGELEEAESLLVGLEAEHPEVGRDLAWVYERLDEPERALAQIEAYLAHWPEDRLAKAQHLRLRARIATPDELVAEVDTLVDLGEDPPPALMATYVERLIELGNVKAARRFIAEREDLDPYTAVGIGWSCFHRAIHDLALPLLLRGLSVHANNFKYRSALETSASRTGRWDELIAGYAEQAKVDPRFFGRVKKLEARRDYAAAKHKSS